MKTLGWIGLGHMGSPMALNLMKEGNIVNVYNRSEEKTAALTDAGATKRDTPKEIVENSDIIFLMLSDGTAIRSVLTQGNGILDADCEGKIIVDMSTIAPQESSEFAEMVGKNGGKYIDAPVSGSVGAAVGKMLLVLAGGEKEIVDQCRPYFLTLGKDVIYFGKTGMGTSAKLTINMLLGIMAQGFGEVMNFGEQIGLGKDQIVDLISKSAMNNGLFQAKKDMYLSESFPSAFMLELMSKDLSLAKQVSLLAEIELPLASAADSFFKEAKGHGKGKLDMSAVYLEIKEKRKNIINLNY